mgnify:CR=1 FL=1
MTLRGCLAHRGTVSKCSGAGDARSHSAARTSGRIIEPLTRSYRVRSAGLWNRQDDRVGAAGKRSRSRRSTRLNLRPQQARAAFTRHEAARPAVTAPVARAVRNAIQHLEFGAVGFVPEEAVIHMPLRRRRMPRS